MYTIDIDTGGTMTDALVSNGHELRTVKVDTTPHDYTVSFRECIAEGAKAFGFESVRDFLDRVDIIRWSSTVTSNVLGERRGAKVGVLVTQGHAEDLYGRDRSPVLDDIVAAKNVIALPRDASTQDVLGAIKSLLEEGVRRVCVSLEGSYPAHDAERAVKKIIERQYPDHYLGAVPVLLGSEMAATPHDATRTHYSLINAYVHSQLAASLFKAEDELKHDDRWHGTLLIGHTSGGVARVGKTKAVDTIESGPVFGTFGGAYFARLYGIDNAVCFDVGGTTTKASIVKSGNVVQHRGGDLIEIAVETSFPMLRSAVLGGGSVARVSADGALTLGPDSMGAAPGPACYGLGGGEATLTDALLVLGLLDPNAFLGGRRRLDVERARAAIDKRVAQPLGLDVTAAALRVRDTAVTTMAELVGATLAEAGLDPRRTTLLAFGGNGPLFAALVAQSLDIPDAIVFGIGPVFSAFGSAISDVVHVYERGLRADVRTRDGARAFEDAVGAMRRIAARDLDGEGFDVASATVAIEAEMTDGAHQALTAVVDVTQLPREGYIAALLREYDKLAAKDADRTRAIVQAVQLKTSYSLAKHELPKRPADSNVAEASGNRVIAVNGKVVAADVYDWDELRGGATIVGPALASGATMTALVLPGWALHTDEFGNGRLRATK